jgi:hypothetical protein
VSLISEALARARREAARREAADKGLRYPALPAPFRARRRRWPHTVALVTAALGAGLAAGILVMEARSPGTSAGAGGAPPSGAPTGEPATLSPRGGDSAPEPGGPADSPSAARRPPAPEAQAAPPSAALETPAYPAPPPGVEPSVAVHQGTSSPQAPPGPGPPPAAPEPAALPEYLRETTLTGGDKITLAGIAWSEEHPVALLNGQPLGIGEIVHGLTVARIRPDGVELRGRGIALFLRLK